MDACPGQAARGPVIESRADQDSRPKTMHDEYRRYVITLTRDPGIAGDEALIRKHVAYLRELERSGQLVLAGPFEDGGGGMLIVRAPSLAEAETIAAADPFVTSGFDKCQVRAWIISCEENDHLGMA